MRSSGDERTSSGGHLPCGGPEAKRAQAVAHALMCCSIELVNGSTAISEWANDARLDRFYAGTPLLFTREVRLGGLCLLDTEPREFSQAERAALTGMADEVMFHILERELRNCAHLQ